jgi:hypothetical protein
MQQVSFKQFLPDQHTREILVYRDGEDDNVVDCDAM